MRRYEILLPLRFNDGSPVSDEQVGETILELRRRFGAVSLETQTIRGVWQHAGQVYRDDLARVFVDVQDTSENRDWFRQFKERLKTNYQQLDIWIVTHPIEIL